MGQRKIETQIPIAEILFSQLRVGIDRGLRVQVSAELTDQEKELGAADHEQRVKSDIVNRFARELEKNAHFEEEKVRGVPFTFGPSTIYKLDYVLYTREQWKILMQTLQIVRTAYFKLKYKADLYDDLTRRKEDRGDPQGS